MRSPAVALRRIVMGRGLITKTSLAMLAAALLLSGADVSPAHAAGPWWHIGSETVPTNLPPGGEGTIIVETSNLGGEPVEGSKASVAIDNTLPAGLVATAIAGQLKNGSPVECAMATLHCTFAGKIYPYEQIGVSIKVKVSESFSTPTSLVDEASVEGGGGSKVSRALPVPVSALPAGFGVTNYSFEAFNEDGTPATGAGSHPFQLTTSLGFNQTVRRQPIELPRNLRFHLPTGLVGNPAAAAQCSMANFYALVLESDLCPSSTVVGVATVVANEPNTGIITKTVPLFNLVPAVGEPARFGFEVIGKIPVVIDTSVRSGRDYGVDVSVNGATQTAGLLSSQVTIWGVPGDSRHDNVRGWECVAGGAFVNQVKKPCPAEPNLPQQPFLRNPTSCQADPAAEPVRSSVSADSWANPGVQLGAEYAWMNAEGQLLGFSGCEQLPFGPSISVIPEEHSAATPTGLQVSVKVPQQSTLQAGALAEADVRNSTVTLPEGVELSPSAANGLAACSEVEVGYEGLDPSTLTQLFSQTEASCPDASKVGTVHIKTPLLPHELEGSAYLANPAPDGEAGRNPFGSLVALYIVAKDPVSGVLVKLAGEGRLDESSLLVSTSFKNTPQVPFEELRLDLFGGPRASVTTPEACGAFPTSASFAPWSTGLAQSAPSSGQEFLISSGAGGGSCPQGTLPFSPGFTAQSENPTAGAYTPFFLELSRPDGNQALSGIQMHLPGGIAAMLSSVELCSEADAAVSSCPASSEIGHATAVAGLGSEPYVQEGGRVFITGPYEGAPFGIEIVTPAKAGPFDLGFVTVRSKLQIDPNDASVTISSDPLPTQIKGIPLQLKRVLVHIDRQGFQFNPTSCAPKSISGTLTGDQGASAPVSSPFQVGGCENLPFSPQLSATAGGQASKANGTSFQVTVSSKGFGQANIAKVDLALPKQLPSRLTTLQKACVEATFDQNPASCSPESAIGTATIHTPVLRNPLSGPAYLVSHGNAGFPDVEFVLQGEGITLLLDGKTDIKAGITYSRFESAPDAPFTSFETTLPAGPHSALTANVPQSANYSLCGQKLSMPTEITAQNGAKISTTTNVALTGCTQVKGAKAQKLTRAQLLKRCRKQASKRFRHAKGASAKKRRAKALSECQRRYGAKKKARKGRKAQSKQAQAGRGGSPARPGSTRR
jgi:hypothetical protein